MLLRRSGAALLQQRQVAVRHLGFFDNVRKKVQEQIDSDAELKQSIEELKKTKVVETIEDTASKAVNNPFYGWTLKGRNAMTIVAGEIAWK